MDYSPRKTGTHQRLSLPTNTQHIVTSSATTRPPHPSPTRIFSFTYAQLHNVLYRQREVEVVKIEDVKPKINSENTKEAATCEICRGEPKSECPTHGSAVYPRRPSHPGPPVTYAVSSFPDEVQLCWSSVPGAGYGVSAKQHIPVGTWIGPYEGRRLKPEEVTGDSDTTYMWEIFQDGKLACYLDARDENTSSWMRFIRCARYREEQNLYAFQYCGNIYYRAFRDITIDQELLVWYDDKYQQYMGIPLNMQDMAIVDPNGNPLLFDLLAYHNQRLAAATSSQSKERKPQTLVTKSNPVTPMSTPKQSVPLNTTHDVKQTVNVTQHVSTSVTKNIVSPVSQMQGKVTHPFPVSITQPHSVKVTQSPPVKVTQSLPVKVTQPPPVNVTQPFPVNVRQPFPMNVTQPNLADRPRKDFPSACRPSSMSVTQHVTQSLPTAVTRPISVHRPITSPVQSPSRRHRLSSGDKNLSPIKELRQLQKTHEVHAPSNHVVYHVTSTANSPDVRISEGSVTMQMKREEINAEYIDADGMVEFSENGDVSLWKCGQCKKSFAQRALLQIHMCPGMANRPYKCGHCSESFSQSNQLRTHVVTHTNEKPFKCGYCSRTFAGATTLHNHIRTHTGEKPFNCYKCGKNFSQPSQLSRHQRYPTECMM